MMQDYKLKWLFVIGGDGMMYEVINGLKGMDQIELIFVFVGLYNDFFKGFGIKKLVFFYEIKGLYCLFIWKFFVGNINFFYDKV